jgi:hypothetical protein
MDRRSSPVRRPRLLGVSLAGETEKNKEAGNGQ